MTERRKSLDEVKNAIDEFEELVADRYRSEFSLTPPYRFRDVPDKKADWPTDYDKVWENYPKSGPATGVYLFFDSDHLLIYVGKAVSIGGRLGNYLQRGKSDRDSCQIVDAILDHRGTSIRAVILNRTNNGSGNSPCRFLTPALEWYLISKLNPPLNKQGRTGEWPDAPVGAAPIADA